MRPEHLSLLVCPKTRLPLELRDATFVNDQVQEGRLVSDQGTSYPVRDFIPRFVPEENYARSFGTEWNIHHQTQFDHYSQHETTSERFAEVTGWDDCLEGETILEAGSGSGRFTREALDTGATVVSFDYSAAVDANFRSNGSNPRLLLVQADVFSMPFKIHTFPKVFCFGVLQHTPDPRSAFLSIADMLSPGGRIASDIYIKDLLHWALHTKYWVRPFIDRSDPESLYRRTMAHVDCLWPLARILRRLPAIGSAINWRLLVADYSRVLPEATDEMLREWAYLDTFDMLSPVFDKPQTVRTFRKWHENAGLADIDVGRGHNGVVGRAKLLRLTIDSRPDYAIRILTHQELTTGDKGG